MSREAAQESLPLLHISGARVFLPDFAKEARLVSRTQGEDGSLRLEFAGGDFPVTHARHHANLRIVSDYGTARKPMRRRG